MNESLVWNEKVWMNEWTTMHAFMSQMHELGKYKQWCYSSENILTTNMENKCGLQRGHAISWEKKQLFCHFDNSLHLSPSTLQSPVPTNYSSLNDRVRSYLGLGEVMYSIKLRRLWLLHRITLPCHIHKPQVPARYTTTHVQHHITPRHATLTVGILMDYCVGQDSLTSSLRTGVPLHGIWILLGGHGHSVLLPSAQDDALSQGRERRNVPFQLVSGLFLLFLSMR